MQGSSHSSISWAAGSGGAGGAMDEVVREGASVADVTAQSVVGFYECSLG